MELERKKNIFVKDQDQAEINDPDFLFSSDFHIGIFRLDLQDRLFPMYG